MGRFFWFFLLLAMLVYCHAVSVAGTNASLTPVSLTPAELKSLESAISEEVTGQGRITVTCNASFGCSVKIDPKKYRPKSSWDQVASRASRAIAKTVRLLTPQGEVLAIKAVPVG